MKSVFCLVLTTSLVAAPALVEAQEIPPLPEKTVILPRGRGSPGSEESIYMARRDKFDLAYVERYKRD